LLRRMGRPFLDWTGKAERLSFDVPALPLFIHERLSTRAIVETLTGHRRDKQQTMFELFGDPQHSVADQVLRAYEYPDKWVNRLVLGDSLVVMNTLLHYEGLGGQVQIRSLRRSSRTPASGSPSPTTARHTTTSRTSWCD
jgi:adenine-specific DNA-methyltransferase